jgi:uncharacterized membrane protein YjjP (DUF1212 family)
MHEAAAGEGGAQLGLEPIAMVALEAGRMMSEAGASGGRVQEVVELVARGLGAERVDLRVGYASLAITIGIGESGITRMRTTRPPGVNKRLEEALWHLAKRVSQGSVTAAGTSSELQRLATGTRRHSPLVVAAAVGLACAAFGRLMNVDWPATVSVLVGSAAAQYVRHALLSRHVNAFLVATPVAFLSSLLAGLGASWFGSTTVNAAMVASILLLVPGVPAINAQTDILEGRPTLGSARAMTVMMTMTFAATGLWLGKAALDFWSR